MNTDVSKPRCEAFTLLEMLVAMAVVGLMMAFMFNLVGQAIKTWEVGGRRMEGAQAARIGMSYLASELQFAMAGRYTNAGNPTPTNVNIAPFLALQNASSLPGEGNGNLQAALGSDQIFFVAPVGPIGKDQRPFAEIGYMNLFARSTGAHTMIGQRYYLVRHGASPGSPGTNGDFQDFYYRGSANLNTNWAANAASTANRTPLVDNCIQFNLEYATTNISGDIEWTNTWTNQTLLPRGVLITMRVLDNKSANRLAALRGDNRLTTQQLEFLTNGVPSTDPAIGILREGTTTLRKFVAFPYSSTP